MTKLVSVLTTVEGDWTSMKLSDVLLWHDNLKVISTEYNPASLTWTKPLTTSRFPSTSAGLLKLLKTFLGRPQDLLHFWNSESFFRGSWKVLKDSYNNTKTSERGPGLLLRFPTPSKTNGIIINDTHSRYPRSFSRTVGRPSRTSSSLNIQRLFKPP